jgi:pilus assembly protein Flp/PilA
MTNFVAALQARSATARARLADRDRGATAVEYALIASLIAAAIVGLVAALGNRIGAIFTNITGAI